MTIDEMILDCQTEVVSVFNKYRLPASVVMLICDSMKAQASQQIKVERKENETNGNINEENNISSSEDLSLR